LAAEVKIICPFMPPDRPRAMDRWRTNDQYKPMRAVLVMGLLISLAACSGDPKSYGITGPGQQPIAPVAPTPDPNGSTVTPGVPTPGSYYGSSIGPIPSNSGYYGYN
jgi:hypothetical protein